MRKGTGKASKRLWDVTFWSSHDELIFFPMISSHYSNGITWYPLYYPYSPILQQSSGQGLGPHRSHCRNMSGSDDICTSWKAIERVLNCLRVFFMIFREWQRNSENALGHSIWFQSSNILPVYDRDYDSDTCEEIRIPVWFRVEPCGFYENAASYTCCTSLLRFSEQNPLENSILHPSSSQCLMSMWNIVKALK